MEKKIHSIIKELPCIKIYLDEIEEIISILKEEGFSQITIETMKHKYSSDEIKKIQQNENIIEIYSDSPHLIRVSFKNHLKSGVFIYSSTDNALAHGILIKIENILKNKDKKLFTILINNQFKITHLLIVQVLSFFLYSSNIINLKNLILILLCTIALYLIFSLLILSSFYFKNTIILEKRPPQYQFIRNNKDKLIIKIISSIILSGITYFVVFLFDHIISILWNDILKILNN